MRTSSQDTLLSLPDLSMIRVEKGSFVREGHRVTLSAFELAAFPVTQALWEAVMGEGSNPSWFEGPRRPVERVTWYYVVAFCNRLNHLEKLPFCYFSDEQCTQPYTLEGEWPNTRDTVYFKPASGASRLPTEAEWEYAARGGAYQTNTEYAGSDRIKDAAWHYYNCGDETQSVGLLQPNVLDLYDMSGNLHDLCWDWYGEYQKRSKPDPSGPEIGLVCVFRGGFWYDDFRYVRVSHRDFKFPNSRTNGLGFRLARTM